MWSERSPFLKPFVNSASPHSYRCIIHRFGICDIRFAWIWFQICVFPSYSGQENANLHPDSHTNLEAQIPSLIINTGQARSSTEYGLRSQDESDIIVRQMRYCSTLVSAQGPFLLIGSTFPIPKSSIVQTPWGSHLRMFSSLFIWQNEFVSSLPSFSSVPLTERGRRRMEKKTRPFPLLHFSVAVNVG